MAEKVSESLVLNAFEAIAGDPTAAISAAKQHSSIDTWVNAQSLQVGTSGALALAIPGLHLVGLAADLTFLMHKLAYTCWGIGELKGCVVLGKEDFANILAIWAGAITPGELDRKAISKASFQTALLAGGGTVAGLSVAAIAANLTGKQIATMGGQIAGSLLARKVVAKTASKGSAVFAGRVGGKLGAKIAGKLAAKFTGKLGAKAFAGVIPLIGPAVGAGVNVYFIRDITKSACAYYGGAV
ncbi:MAG: hypothetical protein HC897_12415 [Thermoanaerobaculia bacterium]|nr:hypothetical protein [Thermoanaerobaculia bacterium]